MSSASPPVRFRSVTYIIVLAVLRAPTTVALPYSSCVWLNFLQWTSDRHAGLRSEFWRVRILGIHLMKVRQFISGMFMLYAAHRRVPGVDAMTYEAHDSSHQNAQQRDLENGSAS